MIWGVSINKLTSCPVHGLQEQIRLFEAGMRPGSNKISAKTCGSSNLTRSLRLRQLLSIQEFLPELSFEFNVPRDRGHSAYQLREEDYNRIMSTVEHSTAVGF